MQGLFPSSLPVPDCRGRRGRRGAESLFGDLSWHS